jgi:hypothetical protein
VKGPRIRLQLDASIARRIRRLGGGTDQMGQILKTCSACVVHRDYIVEQRFSRTRKCGSFLAS